MFTMFTSPLVTGAGVLGTGAAAAAVGSKYCHRVVHQKVQVKLRMVI